MVDAPMPPQGWETCIYNPGYHKNTHYGEAEILQKKINIFLPADGLFHYEATGYVFIKEVGFKYVLAHEVFHAHEIEMYGAYDEEMIKNEEERAHVFAISWLRAYKYIP
jgi:hypothetical protein